MLEYQTVVLNNNHSVSCFFSGENVLDNYIKSYAQQDIKRKLAVTYVYPKNDTVVSGYYTLSSNSILSSDLNDDIKRKLPKYPLLPATLVGRLAVNKTVHSKGIGKTLLLDALFRAYDNSSKIGSMAVVVDALNQNAEQFYQHFGFTKFTSYNKLYIPMQTIGKLL